MAKLRFSPARMVGAFAVVLLASAAPRAIAGHSTGHTLWTSKCDTCHTTTPSGTQLNAAGTTPNVLNYVITNQATMAATPAVATLSQADRDLIATYINSVLPAISLTTPMSTARSVDVAGHITLGGVAFSSVATELAPTNGTLSTWGADTIATYTPNAGFVGVDTFKYKGFRSGVDSTGSARTVTITVGSAPVITSATSKSGTVGTSLTYTITATNNPSSFGAANLPAGLTRSGATISGSPDAAGTFTLPSVSAFNALGNDSQGVTFTIAKGTQTITFNAATVPSRAFTGGNFLVSPGATVNSGLSITYTSTTPAVCSNSGNIVTMLNVGTCTIAANQSGDGNWFAATQKTQSVTITQGSQTITFPVQTTTSRPFVNAGTFAISPVATTSSGLPVTYGRTAGSSAFCSVSGTTVTMLSAGSCVLTADQAGNGNYAAATQVQRLVSITATVPGAPTIGTATAGDSQATVAFTPPASNGGTAITGYTATCTPSGMAIGTASPIVVPSLTNGTPYTCSVRAENSMGLGAASGTVGVTPTAAPVPPAITSANNVAFTIGTLGTFTVTKSGTPSPALGISGTLPPDVTFNPATGVLSGTPAAGTGGSGATSSQAYPITFTATSSTTPAANQSFTLTVNRIPQTISFSGPTDTTFTTSTIPLSATATSGQPVSFNTSLTPTVCTITGGTNLSLTTIGTCTVTATQAGTPSFAPAPGVNASFLISKGNQAVTFATQTVPSRAFTGGTFAINPVATASSGLTVAHGSASPGVCTVAGTTVTMVGVGTCTLSANQPGDTNFNAAGEVTQTVTITQGTQTILFPAQVPSTRSFVQGGTFSLNPVATTNSNLTIAYSSTTESVCTVLGTTITMLGVGNCTVAANQEGNANFGAATQVTRTIPIVAAAPGAPTIGTATPGNGQASVAFTAPASDGGAAITGYTVTCNPHAHTGTGSASPIVVSGLENNTLHTCTVTATNSAGTSAPSGSANVTPSQQGAQLWLDTCNACHGPVPGGTRFNAAGTTATVLNEVMHATRGQAEMRVNPSIIALTQQQRLDLVAHITSYFTPVVESTTPNTAKSVSLGSHITLTGISFTGIEVVTPPTNGTLSAFSGNAATYTPNFGFTGVDTFTYRGTKVGSYAGGDAHTATINVTTDARLLTVTKSGAGTGTVITFTGGSGINCGSDCAEAYASGIEVGLIALPGAQSTFAGWTGACAGLEECYITMDQARTVNAIFNSVAPGNHLMSVVRNGSGSGTVTSSPAAIDCGITCSAQIGAGLLVTLTSTASGGSVFSGWSGAGCNGTGTCQVTMDQAKSVTATFQLVASGSLTPGTGTLDFGGQSMGTTSPPLPLTLTNTGGSSVTVTDVTLTSGEFSRSHNCGTLAAGASCTVSVTFTPAVQPGALNAAFGVGSTLNVTHTGSGSPIAVTVLGTAEKSLVTHYYRSILRRAPDTGGVPYWQGEAARVAGLGANVNETWFALAQAFYTSTEYLAFNRDDTGFVTDLYNTFFNRAPDDGGLGYWTGLLAQGMPREVVLVSFMFSTEFANFTQAIFGNTAARAEVDTVVDFYRGLLSRLPDSGGFNYWVGEFRDAQCSGGAAVYSDVEGISNAYVNSPEYSNRGRNNAQFVGDMYNAFLRRGGDLGGVQYWVGQLDTGARTRENVRQAFISTPEFNQRVVAVINQGCNN